MSYDTEAIITDVNKKPIPQYYNPVSDAYEVLSGRNGAGRAELYGSDGNPIGTTSGKLNVRASELETALASILDKMIESPATESTLAALRDKAGRTELYGPDGNPIGTAGNPLQVKAHDTDTVLGQIKDALGPLATETKLEAVRALLAALEGKDFATQTTLAQVKQVLDTLTGAVSTSSKQDALNIAVEDLKSELILVKSELANIKANQLSGDQKVTLSGTFTEDILSKVDLSNSLLALIGHGQTKAVLNSWQQVQHIVRAGLHPQVFQVGDQFMALFDGEPFVWDVIGIDHDKPTDPRFAHSLTIQSHDCLSNAQFSAPQALYYAEAPLPAGQHRFTLDNVQYTFTTSQIVPAGGQVFISGWETDGYVPTAITTYAADRTTTIETDLVVTQSAGADTLSPVNHHGRCRWGSNNYTESAIRQWLNSEASSFVWTPQTIYDRPPAIAAYTGAGFLQALDPDLVAVLGAVDKQVARNTVTDGGGQDIFSDKVFLLSRTEVYGGTEGDTTGESPYAYYAALADSPTTEGLDGRIKYLGSSASAWWLRSPVLANAGNPRTVITNGAVSGTGALSSYGVAPAVVIV